MERIPGQGWTALCTPEMTIEQGGGSCNIVARSFLDRVPSADVAIQNSGSCRSDIAAGNFKYEDAFRLLPFQNDLLTLEMPADQIKLVLEQAMNHIIINEQAAVKKITLWRVAGVDQVRQRITTFFVVI